MWIVFSQNSLFEEPLQWESAGEGTTLDLMPTLIPDMTILISCYILFSLSTLFMFVESLILLEEKS